MSTLAQIVVSDRRRVNGLRWSAALGLVLALTGGSPLIAQSTTGTILGTVKDSSAGVVSGAAVQLTNTGTASTRSLLTDSSGDYNFSSVEVGSYRVTITAPGFQKTEFTAFPLAARETKRLDAALTLATQATTVNVESGDTPTIQTDTSSISETKTGRELIDLPVAITTRASGSTSPMSTLTTQPGVQTDASGGISVAGALPTMLSMTVDGISTMGARTNGPLTELFPSFNAIEEIRIGQVINPAEFSGVADITTISKSGTNRFHGGLFENFQNNVLNASNTFSHTTPTLKMNDFGFYVGGPVFFPKLYNGRDKTFFFVDYEGLRLPRQSVAVEKRAFPGNAERRPLGTQGPVDRISRQHYPRQSNIAPGAKRFELFVSAAELWSARSYIEQLSGDLQRSHQKQSRRRPAGPNADTETTDLCPIHLQNRRVTNAPTATPVIGGDFAA